MTACCSSGIADVFGLYSCAGFLSCLCCELPVLLQDSPSQLSEGSSGPGAQHCLCDLERLLAKLPARALNELSLPSFAKALHQSRAQKLILQEGRRMQVVAVARGNLRSLTMPEIQLTQQDLVDIAEELRLPNGKGTFSAMQPVAGGIHRVSIGYSVQQHINSISFHLGRLLPGISDPVRKFLDSGSCVFLGPSRSGKTTVMRDVASSLSKSCQVVVVDFFDELHQGGLGLAGHIVSPSATDTSHVITQVSHEHSPDVIVAEFSQPAEAIAAARVCGGSGQRLICSVPCALNALVESFFMTGYGAYVYPCISFPFRSAIMLRQELDFWQIYEKVQATVCAMSWSTACPEHRAPRQEILFPTFIPLKPLLLSKDPKKTEEPWQRHV